MIYITFSGHWINDNYKRKSAAIPIGSFHESHTFVNTGTQFETTADLWNLGNGAIYVVITDIAFNIKKIETVAYAIN